MYSQQQQQHYYGPAPTNTQQQQHTWNGQQWVAAANTSVPQSLVTKYTQLYHAYTKKAQQPSGTPNSKQWAQYHADCAAYAAHYFHQHPTATTLPEGRVLPPDITGTSVVVAGGGTCTAAAPVTTHHSNNNNKANNTMQGYLARCKAQLKDPQQAAQHVQTVVQRELQAGQSLHTIDWANMAVPSGMPSRWGAATKSSSNNNNNRTYVAPTYTAKSSSKKRKQMESQSNTAGHESYYGPTSSSSSHQSLQAPRNTSKKSSKTKDKNGFNQSKSVLKNRAARFGTMPSATHSTNSKKYTGVHGGSNKVLDATDYERMTVKGTCTTLAKQYLRLTAPPRPELVRPLHILQAHLANLEQQLQTDPSINVDYEWMCSQLKAIRQDCTVQRIQNEFTLRVYVVHARTALLHHDLNEFNQCQTQLVTLFQTYPDHPDHGEFLAYRILYHMVVASPGHAVLHVLRDALQHPHDGVHQAIALRQAYAQQNVVLFWRIYTSITASTATTTEALLSPLLPTVRRTGLQLLLQAYTPTHVGFDVVRSYTGIVGDDDTVRVWLEDSGCVVDTAELVTKDSKLVDGGGLANSTASSSLM